MDYKVIKFNENTWLNPYIDRNTDLQEKSKWKMVLKNIILSWWIMPFLEKISKILFSIRTKFSYYKVIHRKVISNRNEQNWNT